MHWLLNHPYTMLVVSTCVLLFIGFVVVQGRTPVSPNAPRTSSWGNVGGIGPFNFEPAETSNQTEHPDLFRTVQNLPPFLYVPPAQNIDTHNTSRDTFDFEAFLAELSRPKKSSSTSTNPGLSTEEIYSYIPSSIVVTIEPSSTRTESQEALFRYGNEAGQIIQLFEDRNRSMARVLKDQFEDPTNPEKNAALTGLGNALIAVGESLEQIESIPSQATSVHARLAQSYKAAGEKLALVPNATTDEEKIAAMLAYNAAAEDYVRSYIAMVRLFSLSNVTFSSSDPGSVFMFSATGL